MRTPGMAICGVMMLAVAAARGAGERAVVYEELMLVGGYSDEEEWVGGMHDGQKNAAGFEYLRKFGGERGDYLTLDVQARVSYDTSDEDMDERWALELHNAWLDYKPGLGKALRVGHFDPAFGLEPKVDTHGTLFQTLAGQDIGFKKDWGAAYRSSLKALDYEFSAGLGSGMGLKRRDGSFLLAGRIDSPPGGDLRLGLSAAYGEVLASMQHRTLPEPDFSDEGVRKQRLGVDAQYGLGPYSLMGEVTAGRNETNDVAGALLEIGYTVPSLQTLKLQVQGRTWTDDPDDSERRISTVGAGFSYDLRSDLAIRLAVFHDLERPDMEDTAVYVQLYYYGR